MIRSTLWFFLLAALVAGGVRGAAAHLEWLPPFFRDVHATTDELAKTLVQMEHGTDVLSAVIAEVPPSRALLVVGPGNDGRLTEIHYLISSLAWPRPVWALGQVESGPFSRYSVLPKEGVQPAAMLFYLVPVPRELQPRARQLAADLTWVPLPD